MRRGAGYRACRRCRPGEERAVDPWIDKIRRACVYLANVDGHLSLARLAARVGGSPYHFQRSFKRIVGVTPREYADACRLTALKRGLRQGSRVTGGDGRRGIRIEQPFLRTRGRKARDAAGGVSTRAGQACTCRYAIVDCPLGRLLVAATERGVCGGVDGIVGRGSGRARSRRSIRPPSFGRSIPRLSTLDAADREPSRRAATTARSAARRAGDGVSVAGVDGARGDPVRRDPDLPGGCGVDGPAVCGSRGCTRLRDQPGLAGHPVSPGRSGRAAAWADYRWGIARKKALLAAEHRMKD